MTLNLPSENGAEDRYRLVSKTVVGYSDWCGTVLGQLWAHAARLGVGVLELVRIAVTLVEFSGRIPNAMSWRHWTIGGHR